MTAPGDTCWHCGEPLRGSAIHVRVGDTSRSVCCQGCGAAVEWIVQLGLGDYYRLRTVTRQDLARMTPASTHGSDPRSRATSFATCRVGKARQCC